MNLDIRAQRAADGVRTSTIGLNPMTALSDLKQENTNRRRARAAGLAGTLAVVVALGAWLVTGPRNGAAPTPGPLTSSSTSPSQVATETRGDGGTAVGLELRPTLPSVVPQGWTISCDCGFVWLARPDGPVIEVSSALVAASDPVTGKDLAPPRDLAAWLHAHPWLTVTSDTTVLVDGKPARKITFTATSNLPTSPTSDGLHRLMKASGIPQGQPWFVAEAGKSGTWVILPAGHGYQLVTAFGAEDAAQKAELAKGLSDYLASIRLP
jgi:hypothetical protein